MKDKMRKNYVEIRIIKWERIWNDEREREREREREIIFATTTSQVTKESKIIVIAKPKRA